MVIDEGNMDKPVSAKTKRKRIIKGVLAVSAVILVSVFGILGIKHFLTPVFNKNRIKIGVVSRGLVYESVTASGIVETKNENIILSPVTSKLLHIVHGAGAKVEKGDTLVLLETTSLKDHYLELQNQLKLKKNAFWQLQLNTDKQTLTLAHNLDVKKLRITELEAQLSAEKQLFEVGGTSGENIRKSRQELDLANKELELALKENSIEIQKLKASKEAQEVEIAMAEQAVKTAGNLVDKAFVLAPISGIVVEVNGREGEMVNANSPLVRISDLESFKLTGTIGDSFADKINTGYKVLAINNKTVLEGVVGNIRPIVDNGQIKFDVYLEQSNHPDLRPNQKMEVRVIVAENDSVLRLPDGPFFDGKKELNVFVVRRSKAYRKPIRVGLSNFDFVEISEGLTEGEEVIISDVADFIHLEEVAIEE